jgi:TonB family protein
MDAVTEVLLDRSQTAEKISRMVVVSFVAHAAILAAFTYIPRHQSADADTSHVMTISIAGAPGPIQGRNPMAGKQVQEAVPDTVKPKNDAPPALVKPEMIEPIKAAKPEPKTVAKPEPKKVEPQLHGRTPTQGAEVKAGGARVETHGAAIPFGGLATGGGAGNATTDFADFCCPEYLQTMQRMIYGNWQQKQGQAGTNKIKFVIQRDGTITDVAVENSAGPFLDIASQRALMQTARLPPLPSAFTPPRLTVHLEFEYKR